METESGTRELFPVGSLLASLVFPTTEEDTESVFPSMHLGGEGK